MPNVKVEMGRGEIAARAPEPTVAAGDVSKLRMKLVPADMKERLKVLDARKQKLAEKRGAWKDATPKQRAEAREVAQQIRDLKAEMRAAAHAQRQAELDKQAAASKREAARKG